MSNTINLDATSKTVDAILVQINGTVKTAGKYAAYVAEYNVTHENVKDHARALADAWADKYNVSERVQKIDGKRTPYGNAVQAAGNGLRSALPKKETDAKHELLTASGKRATREEVIAAWEAAQK